MHKEFYDEIVSNPKALEFIKAHGKLPNYCQHILHPGQTCSQYLPDRFKRSYIAGMKVQFLFTLLPSLISRRHHLRKDFKGTMKQILIKYLKSANFFLFFISIIMGNNCIVSKWPLSLLNLHLISPRLRMILCNCGPASFAVLVQDWSKILAYQGYYGIKSIGILFNSMKQKGLIGTLPFETAIVMMLVVAFLGFAGRREAIRK